MPLIQISQLPGSSAEQRRATIAAVTAAYADSTGKDPATVWVMISEVPRDSWGIGGSALG